MSNLSTDLHEPTQAAAAPTLEVRVDARLAAPLGAIAAVVAIAYLSLADARVPLLVVDEQGVRLRRRRTWHGLPWQDIEVVEHEPRRGLLHDGRVVVVPRDPDAPVLSVPLSVSTRVVGADAGLAEALADLAADPEQVVEIGPEELEDAEAFEDVEPEDVEPEDQPDAGPHHPLVHDPRPTLARGIGFLAARLRFGPAAPADQPTDAPEPTVALPIVASATPAPLRDPVAAIRSEVRFEGRFEGAAALALDTDHDASASERALPEAEQLRRDGLVIDDLLLGEATVEPAADPVIGPELAAARTRLALTVDQLAERTRIRPHVIESIEVDDFAPCGGDFYARGHLRTLARVLGVDAAPLLAAYDERYADAPIDARRVFEAELATGVDGPIRGTRGGPNWSVLVAAVMAIVLAWSIARLVMDSPVELSHKPVLNGSPSSATKLGPAVPVVLKAVSGGAHVVVRDGAGEVVYSGDLAFGDAKTLKATPPVRVQSSDGALQVSVDGQDRGALGADGQPAQNTFAAAD